MNIYNPEKQLQFLPWQPTNQGRNEQTNDVHFSVYNVCKVTVILFVYVFMLADLREIRDREKEKEEEEKRRKNREDRDRRVRDRCVILSYFYMCRAHCVTVITCLLERLYGAAWGVGI